jgi:GntR family transcriptional regulator
LSTRPSSTASRARALSWPSRRIVAIEQEAPNPRICTALAIEPSEPVWKVKRVFLSDGIPLALVSSYLPVSEVESLTVVDVEYSLYNSLERRYNLRPTWASDSYTAVRASGEVLELLSVSEGDPIIYSERVAYLRTMHPIEYVESYIRGDRFTVLVDWLPQDADSESIWSKLNGDARDNGDR